jgi:hypothetical protein
VVRLKPNGLLITGDRVGKLALSLAAIGDQEPDFGVVAVGIQDLSVQLLGLPQLAGLMMSLRLIKGLRYGGHKIYSLVKGTKRLSPNCYENFRSDCCDRVAARQLQDRRQKHGGQSAKGIVFVLRGNAHLIGSRGPPAQVIVAGESYAAIGEGDF